MIITLFQIFFLAILAVVGALGPPPSMKQFVIVAPSIVRPNNQPYSFSLTLFENQGYTLPVTFLAELIQQFGSKVGDVILASQFFQQNNWGVQQFTFANHLDPQVGAASNFTIRLTFNNAALPQTPILSSGVPSGQEYYAFIQTDKKVYRPGQTVYMTAFMLDRDLKPATGKTFSVSVRDAQNSLVGLWSEISPPKSLWSAQLTIPPMMNIGQWIVSLNSSWLPHTVTKTFDVDEYELPRYQIDVAFPNGASWLFVSNDESGYTGQVTANYTFGKTVRGQVKMSLSSTGGCNLNYDNSGYSDTPFSFVFQLYGDGAPEEGFFTANGLNSIIAPTIINGQRVLNQGVCALTFYVTLTDHVSGTSATTFATVTVQRYQYRLDFVDPIPGRSLTPGSSYSLRIKANPTTASSKPGNVMMLETVTLKSGDSYAYCFPNWPGVRDQSQISTKTLNIDRSSFATSPGQFVASDTKKLGFKAWIPVPNNAQDRIGEACAVYDVQSDHAVLISIEDTPQRESAPKLGDSVTFKVSINFNADVYFLLTGQNGGQIATHQKLAASDFVTTSGSWQTATVKQNLLNPNLPPRAAAIAWAIDPASNRFYSDVVSFKVVGLVKQNVSLGYDDDSVSAAKSDNCPARPKSQKQLNVATTEPHSLVALLAVDKRVRLLPRNQQSAVTNEAVLRMIDRGFSGDQWDLDESDLCWSCGAWFWYPGDALFTKTPETLFRSVDMMLLIGNATILSFGRALPSDTASSGENRQLIYSGSIVRRDLPEVWFWTIGETDDKGEFHLPVMLPDSITAWQTSAFAIGSQLGFGALSTPVELISRKPIFVDLILPQQSVILGEEFAAVCATYNYSPVEVSVTVRLEDLSGTPGGAFEMSADGGVSYSKDSASKTLNLPSNSGLPFVVWIRPLRVGEMPMRVVALGKPKELESYYESDDNCPSWNLDYNEMAMYSDVLEISNFTVEPEGQTRYSNRAFFFRVSPTAANQLTVTERDILGNTSQLLFPIVPGSKMYEVGLNADLMGPVVSDLETDLVRMPAGCGEQILKTVLPNAFIYKYLKTTNQLREPLKTKLVNYILGYLPQLMVYQNPDGGFSTWGSRSPYPNNVAGTWLTAFALRYLDFCSRYVDNFPTDRGAMDRGFAFLTRKINSDGSVTELSQATTHPEMKGGSWRDVNLAMYVYATFAETNRLNQISPANSDALRRTIANVIAMTKDPYQLALAAYATSWNEADKREVSQPAIERLIGKAIRSGSGDSEMIYWEPGDFDLYPIPMQGPSVVETSGYALLAFLNNARYETPAINRWLVTQRNSLGGFDQTQSTVVGLHALSEFAAGIPSVPINMNVTATFTYASGYQWTNAQSPINVNANNGRVFQRISAPYRPSDELVLVTVSAVGSGYLYLQASMRYNVYVAPQDIKSAGFKLNVAEKSRINEWSDLPVLTRPKQTIKSEPLRKRRSATEGLQTLRSTRTRATTLGGNQTEILTTVEMTRPTEIATTRATTGRTQRVRATTRRTTMRSSTLASGNGSTFEMPLTTTEPMTTITVGPRALVYGQQWKEGVAGEGIGDDVSIKICISNATADAKHGMVTMEVLLPSGFVADVEKTKRLNSLRYADASRKNETGAVKDTVSLQGGATVEILRDPRLQQIELGRGKTIVYYFDLDLTPESGSSSNITESCCVIANMYRQAQVRNTKPPYVTVYNYYRPALNVQVAYNFTKMAMPPAK